MTLTRIHRPARTVRPLPALAPRTLEPPPNLPEGKASNAAMGLLPMAGIMGSVVMMTIIRSSQFAVIGAVILVAALVGAVVLVFSQRGKAGRQRRQQRERYLEYLEGLREELSATERERLRAARRLDPPPEALYDLIRDPARLWERRRLDADFLRVRLGTGQVPVRELKIAEHPGGAMTPPDPFMLNEARALLARYATGRGFPLTAPLDRAGDVSIVGDRDGVVRVARALLIHAAVAHAPDDLALALAVPAEEADDEEDAAGTDWSWAKWLPHILDPLRRDGPAAARRIAPSLPQLARLLRTDLRRRAAYAAEVRRGMSGQDALKLTDRLLVVSDTHGRNAAELPRPDEAVTLPAMGITVLHLLSERIHEPGEVSVRITVAADGQVTVTDLRTQDAAPTHGTPGPITPATAEGLARMLAPLRLSAESRAEDAPSAAGPVAFPALLHIDDPAALDLGRLWAPRGERAFLRVPVGVDDQHEPVLLDLKESAELGMGPHGLCVGATGSGKSELLRTLVLALTCTHPPHDLAMILIDYKGGATFAPFQRLPHVAGVITNLENQVDLIERVHTSLAGEVKRRQQVLKDAGDVADIGHYAALRARHPERGLEALPHLFVVIDEFGELLTAKPDFIDLFLSIGRIGRSIGVHLLLSSQRIESGKLKGLETYLSYRLGLRTFSADESRTVLDTTDAFKLPPLPGFGYLKVDTSTYQRFKAGFVSGAHHAPEVHDAAQEGPLVLPYRMYGTGAETPAETGAEPSMPVRETGPTVLSTMVGQIRTAAEPVRRIWLPPLPDALSLDRAGGRRPGHRR